MSPGILIWKMLELKKQFSWSVSGAMTGQCQRAVSQSSSSRSSSSSDSSGSGSSGKTMKLAMQIGLRHARIAKLGSAQTIPDPTAKLERDAQNLQRQQVGASLIGNESAMSFCARSRKDIATDQMNACQQQTEQT